MTKAALLYRIASVLFLLFAAGHTYGFLHFRPPTPEGRAVREAMFNVHFQVRNATFSYGGFYNGFGLFVTASVLFSTILAWHLSGLARTSPQAIGALGWAFFALAVASVVLSWIYFSLIPTLLSILLALCLGWAAWLVQGVKT
jgi:hypothetical protein